MNALNRQREAARVANLEASHAQLLRALVQAAQAMSVEHALVPEYGWGEFLDNHIRPVIAAAEALCAPRS